MAWEIETAPSVDLVLGAFVPMGPERHDEIAGIPCFFVTRKGQDLVEVDLCGSGARPGRTQILRAGKWQPSEHGHGAAPCRGEGMFRYGRNMPACDLKILAGLAPPHEFGKS
jgi:hypothetical protein